MVFIQVLFLSVLAATLEFVQNVGSIRFV